jgi:hypothetical protein
MTETQVGPQPAADAAATPEAQPQPGGMPPLHPVFMKQLEALAAGDLTAVLDTFHPDIVSLGFRGPLYGRDGALAQLRKYEGLDMEFVGIEEYVHCDDLILTRTRMKVKGEEIVAFGAYVIRDGKIWRQFGCDEGGTRDWWAGDGDDASTAQ